MKLRVIRGRGFWVAVAGAVGSLALLLTFTPAEAHQELPSLDLEAYRGKVVYLDFWASWCAPCRESFPFMDALERELEGRGLVVIAINVDTERALRIVPGAPRSASRLSTTLPARSPSVAARRHADDGPDRRDGRSRSPRRLPQRRSAELEAEVDQLLAEETR